MGTDGLTFIDRHNSAMSGEDSVIVARNYGSGSLDISSNGVLTGGDTGIDADNHGTGALSITTTGVVTGTDGEGIYASNRNYSGTNLTLLTGVVNGGQGGIIASNRGLGLFSLTSTGMVSGGHGYGIDARNFGTDMDITTAEVTSRLRAIHALNRGTGVLSITSGGPVTSTFGSGIDATNDGTHLTLNTGRVTGVFSGITATNWGSGELTITSTDEVTSSGSGTSGTGIFASNFGASLTLTTDRVTGNGIGIDARKYGFGFGALSITSSGEVKGLNTVGLYAKNRGGTASTINTASVSGGIDGINAYHYGSGALSITSSAGVEGTRDTGIFAYNASTGSDLSIAVTAVTGGINGIYAIQAGNGALSITNSATVTGTSGYGIFAFNSSTGTHLNLTTAGDVSGGYDGIQVVHNGSGLLTVTTEGVVSGGTGNALWLDRSVNDAASGTITNNGRLISAEDAAVRITTKFNFDGIFINNGDIVGGNGVAFDASHSPHGIALHQAAGTITGDILLGSVNDVVTVTGGSINGQIIGGGLSQGMLQDRGTVNINVGAGNNFIANNQIKVKNYVVQSGTVYQHADFGGDSTRTSVSSGATLSFSNDVRGTGEFISGGNLEFVLGPAVSGQLVQGGSVWLNEGSTITVQSSSAIPLLNEPRQLIFSAPGIVDGGVTIIGGSLLYELEAIITDVSVSVLTTVADLGTISPLGNPSAFGESMTAFINTGGNNAVVDLLADLPAGDVRGFEQIADVFSPSVSGAVAQGSLEANDSTRRLISERFVGSASAYNAHKPLNGLWLQGFGSEADQDRIDDVEGFNADTAGVAMGYDRDLGQWRVGTAFASGETDVDNDRYAGDSIEIESNQFIVYGGYWQNQWFANATASIASLDYDFKRDNLIAGEGRIKSDTDGDLYGVSVGSGYQYNVNGVLLTPQLALRYAGLNVDKFNEHGGLDLRVTYDDVDTFASELGVSASASYVAGNWQLSPIAHIAWIHEYLGDNERAHASYGGQSYTQEGFEPDSDLASLGLGVEAINGQGLSIGLDYRGTLGSDFSRNQGSLNVRYEF
jgi:outer membrane autotransporter protein